MSQQQQSQQQQQQSPSDNIQATNDYDDDVKPEALALALGTKMDNDNNNNNANNNNNNNASTTAAALIQPIQLSSTKSASNNNNSSINNNNNNNDDEEEEEEEENDDIYLRMIHTLGNLEDIQMLESLFQDDDDEEEDDEYCMNDDEENDENEDGDNTSLLSLQQQQQQQQAAAAGASAHRVLPPHPSSHPLPPSLGSPLLESSMDLTRWSDKNTDNEGDHGDDDDNDDNDEDDDLLDPDFFKDIEEELGGLFEEDMEATLQSLLTRPLNDNNNKKRKQQQQQQQQRTTTTSLVVATTTTTGSASNTVTGSSGNVAPFTTTAATATATATMHHPKKTQIQGTITHSQPQQPVQVQQQQQLCSPPPPPPLPTTIPRMEDPKERKLRNLLQRHYQLLIQQCILSIRAAKEIKDDADEQQQQVFLIQQNAANTNATTNATSKSNTSTTTKSSSLSNSMFYGVPETEMDLAEVLDLAVSMLQDLDQVRKDTVRNMILLENSSTIHPNNHNNNNNQNQHHYHQDQHPQQHSGSRRSLMSQFDQSVHDDTLVAPPPFQESTSTTSTSTNHTGENRRLTRSVFQRFQGQQQHQHQQQQSSAASAIRTAFDIPGLVKLNETFAIIDASVETFSKDNNNNNNHPNSNSNEHDECNILKASTTHAQACQNVLQNAGANVHEEMLPAGRDLAENFTSITETLGIDDNDDDNSYRPPITITPQQELALRKNRNLFTAAEDNLILRGVNLYGEKQWLLIADRYLPDRSVHAISQRYNQLCVMIYLANGVRLDRVHGTLPTPPKYDSVDDIDEQQFQALRLQKVPPPDILNVHRWSIEEDLALLKAVPIMGNM
jgi:Myb-like DNA-binding domain